MTPLRERVYSWLLRLYPRTFREQYGDDLLAFFRQDREHPRYGRGPLRPVRFWLATVRDLVRTAWRQRQNPGALLVSPTLRPARGLALRRLRMDLRDSWRGLRASPGVTAAILVILALGIGSSAAIFSVVDAVALRGLPFDDGSRLIRVAETDLSSGRPTTVAPQNYAEFRARLRTFDGLGASANAGQLSSLDWPGERLRAVKLTSSLFDVLRVTPAAGRRFTSADEQPGAPPVALLSDKLWRSHFGARADVLGGRVRFENAVYDVVGVMPPGFTYPIGSIAVSDVDFWIPFVPTIRDTSRDLGRSYSMTVVGRLRRGVSVGEAAADARQVHDALALEYPRWFRDHGVDVRPLQDAIVGTTVRSWMLLLLGSVGCVLLIACLNVANLLLARAAARAREVAVRAALGARPWDLARALMVESLSLSLLGATVGVLLAFWGVRILRATLPDDVPRLASVAVDLRVLIVACAAAVVTGILFGVLPARLVARPDTADALRASGRNSTAGRTAQRLRQALVTAQVAVAVVLVSAAGLFLSSFLRVVAVDLGFQTDRVLTIGVSPQRPASARSVDERMAAAAPQVLNALERVAAVPGVLAAAVVGGGAPIEGSFMTVPVQVGDKSFAESDWPFEHDVTPAYLDVLGIPLIRGRWIASTDTRTAPRIVVLTAEAATRYFGQQDPLGQILVMNQTPRSVVGIVAGSRFRGPERAVPPEVYVPYVQGEQSSPDIVLRTALDPAAVTGPAHAALQSALPGGYVAPADTIDRHLATLVAQRKFNMVVLVLFGSMAILIAAAGVYGLLAYLVSQRTREIGVRLALGAAPAGILRMVLTRALALLLTGLVVGLVAVTALERAVRSFLFQSQSYELAVYGGVALVLVATGLAAAFGPARRAARVDPLIALRAE